MGSLTIRAAALVLERAQLTDSSERCVQLNPGATVGHVRLDSAAVEAATVLPPPGAKKTGPPTSLLDVLGGPCRTIAGSRLVEAWLRQPSRDKSILEKRHKAVEALRDAQDGREALRSALGTTKGARIPDVSKLCAKLRQGKATLVDLHRLHVSRRRSPEVLAAAEAIDTDAIKDIVPPLAKASRDLRVFCDMARATLDLDYLPEVLLKPTVDEELVQHSEAMRQARDAVDDAHKNVNEAFADAGLGKGLLTQNGRSGPLSWMRTQIGALSSDPRSAMMKSPCRTSRSVVLADHLKSWRCFLTSRQVFSSRRPRSRGLVQL